MKLISEAQHSGYKINSDHGGVYEPILENLIKLGEKAMMTMREPVAYLISFPFKDDQEITLLMDRIKKRYSRVGAGRKKESTFKPAYLWVRESKFLTPDDEEWGCVDNPTAPYDHYHLCLILDAKKATTSSIKVIFDIAVSEGLINHYHISKENKTKTLFKKLNEQFQEYVYWMSYLAKAKTKVIEKGFRCYGNSAL